MCVMYVSAYPCGGFCFVFIMAVRTYQPKGDLGTGILLVFFASCIQCGTPAVISGIWAARTYETIWAVKMAGWDWQETKKFGSPYAEPSWNKKCSLDQLSRVFQYSKSGCPIMYQFLHTVYLLRSSPGEDSVRRSMSIQEAKPALRVPR